MDPLQLLFETESDLCTDPTTTIRFGTDKLAWVMEPTQDNVMATSMHTQQGLSDWVCLSRMICLCRMLSISMSRGHCSRAQHVHSTQDHRNEGWYSTHCWLIFTVWRAGTVSGCTIREEKPLPPLFSYIPWVSWVCGGWSCRNWSFRLDLLPLLPHTLHISSQDVDSRECC